MVGPVLVRRDMPQLTTASGSSAHPSSTTASKTSSASTTSYTAVVTAPSADGNPNIWRSDNVREGTVYIAVGSVVGAIFAFFLLWYITARYLSRKRAKQSTYRRETQLHLSGWSNLDGALYDEGEEKELYQSSADHAEKNDIKSKKPLIGLLGGDALRASTSFDTLPETDVDDELLGGYQERFNTVQDVVPNHFSSSSLFISPTLEVVQQQQSRNPQGRSNHFQNMSMTSLASTVEAPNNLDRPERAASPERKPKAYERYHQRNKSSVAVSEHSKSSSEGEPNRQAPTAFLNNLLEGKGSM